jgi:uncharacterized protein with von Willebrand factor type A (vWA) domain
VWHCSVSNPFKHRELLRRVAYEILEGGVAFHLRRRLNAIEQARVGEVIDYRSTDEGWKRFEAIKTLLPNEALLLANEELL